MQNIVNMLKILGALISFWVSIAICTNYINVKSNINGKYLRANENYDKYSFLVAGHIYGHPEPRSVYPSGNVLANIDVINEMGVQFFISLGDNFRMSDFDNMNNFIESFGNKLSMPMFNSVGNHDVSDRGNHLKQFPGKTFYDYTIGSELMIVLDSELDESRISNEQLDYLRAVLSSKAQSYDIENIFVFSHKLIWAANLEKYSKVWDLSNGGVAIKDNNFNQFIFSALTNIAAKKNVYWVSGDIGTRNNSPSIFFEKDADSHVTFIATGISNNRKDRIIKVNIIPNQEPIFELIPLGQKGLSENIMDYGLSYWSTLSKKEWMSYSSKIQNLLVNKIFWIGIAFGMMITAIVFMACARYFRNASLIDHPNQNNGRFGK